MPFPIDPTSPAQVLPLERHLAEAVALDADTVTALRALAIQLSGEQILPILGAGASHDCGMKLAGAIGRDLHDAYVTDGSFDQPQNLGTDLGQVADAIRQARGQIGAVKAIGLDERRLWPEADAVTSHYCTYRPIARLAREDAFQQAIGFNYDCGNEAAMKEEGYLRGRHTAHGRDWDDHLTVITDAATNSETRRRGAFIFFKAHGCAERFRELATDDERVAAATIVLCKSQLTNWRRDYWMRDEFRSRARSHVLLLLGFSGNDPVVVGEISDVLRDVHEHLAPGGIPRIIAIDHSPDTTELRTLIDIGLGGQALAGGAVAQIATSGATMSGVLTVFLAETLAHKLDQELTAAGVALPDGLDSRLAELIVSVPVMLRWTYLLGGRGANQFAQNINLREAAHNGYVPVTKDPESAIRLLVARRKLRELFGRTAPESYSEALGERKFVSNGSMAFLPVDLAHDELRGVCRPGGGAADIATAIGTPSLDSVLVSAQGDMNLGFTIDKGAEVPVW